MEKFFEHLDKESAQINAILNDPKPMAPLTVEEKERYQLTKNCGNCGIEFDDDIHSRSSTTIMSVLNSSTQHVINAI